MKSAIVCFILISLSACGGSGGSDDSAMGSPPPVAATPEVSIVEAFTGVAFEQPIAMVQEQTDDERWFVMERAGRIKDVQSNGVSNGDLIDIRAQVNSTADEAGLLGFAFHPDFSVNGEAFLSYTRDIGGGLESVVSRVRSTDGGSTLDISTEEILLSVIQDFGNHNGGQIDFGSDGLLYIAFGDGGSGDDPNNRSQTTTNLMGAIVRIDVDTGNPYTIPSDNPFSGNALCAQGFGGADCPEIYAWGLRNPWKFGFDSANDDLWLGEVGQGRYEEINRVTLGSNYGWRIREGAHCNIPLQGCDETGLVDPYFEYEHDVGSSVTGGYVYRGSAIAGLSGNYIFGDFISGRIWMLPTSGSNIEATELVDTDLNISSFAQDNNNELFAIDYSSGKIYTLE